MPSPRGNGKIKGEKGQCRQLIAAYKKQRGQRRFLHGKLCTLQERKHVGIKIVSLRLALYIKSLDFICIITAGETRFFNSKL
jgi:hypothetical protein